LTTAFESAWKASCLPDPSLLSREVSLSWKIKMAAALTRKFRVLAATFPALVTQCCCPSATLTFFRIQVRCKGHSQWQNRKFKKAHNDFVRSKEFGKLSMEIIAAVRGKAEWSNCRIPRYYCFWLYFVRIFLKNEKCAGIKLKWQGILTLSRQSFINEI